MSDVAQAAFHLTADELQRLLAVDMHSFPELPVAAEMRARVRMTIR